MRGKVKTATCTFIGLLGLALVAQPEFARSKAGAGGAKQKFTAAHTTLSPAARPAPQQEVGKVIMVLQTREHRVTVRSSGGTELRYSVATVHGIVLADGLSVADLKGRFPEVHDVVTGIAWAGVGRQAR